MPLSRFEFQRLEQLEKQLGILYEKRGEFEEELLITANANQRFELKQRLKREVLPNLRSTEKEYAELLVKVAEPDQLTETESQALIEDVQQAVVSHEHAHSGDKSEDLQQLLTEIRAKLDEPDKAAAAKLKVVLPLIPLIASYELELDTESFLTQVWQRVKSAVQRLIPTSPP